MQVVRTLPSKRAPPASTRGRRGARGHPGVVNYLPADVPHTITNWIVEPDGLYDVLRALDREAPGLPLYITENGCAADDYVDPEGRLNDYDRVDYLHRHFDAAWRAIRDGVNLAGYFVWSLMDNFEWARFGLYTWTSGRSGGSRSGASPSTRRW